MPDRPARATLVLAHRIVRQAQALAAGPGDLAQRSLDGLLNSLEPLRRLQAQLQFCQQKGWPAAAVNLRERLAWNLGNLAQEIQALGATLDPQRPAQPPSLRQVLADLQQIRSEFGGYDYDPGAHSLSVSTEPIALGSIDLGPFQVRLALDRLCAGQPARALQVVALDPHPASSNEAVTHPHVSEEALCAGEAASALNAALTEARLCDAFLLVRSVLQHYNPSSAYVSLDRWEGIACPDCGASIPEQEGCTCDACDDTFCSQCIGACEVCDASRCPACLDRCPACDRRICGSCARRCGACGQHGCEACIEQGRCQACRQPHPPAQPEDPDHGQTEPTCAGGEDPPAPADDHDQAAPPASVAGA